MKTLDVVRVDKWMWSVRLYKNRKEATLACGRNEVSVDGQVSKASRNVRIGMIIETTIKGFKRKFRITELAQKPVGNDRGHLYYEDLTDPEILEEIQNVKAFQYKVSTAQPSVLKQKLQKTARKYTKDKKGRPTKKERRQRDQMWEG